ncbi:MAG: hypothetical protein RR922_03665 [Clostridia bacterium]
MLNNYKDKMIANNLTLKMCMNPSKRETLVRFVFILSSKGQILSYATGITLDDAIEKAFFAFDNYNMTVDTLTVVGKKECKTNLEKKIVQDNCSVFVSTNSDDDIVIKIIDENQNISEDIKENRIS